MSGDELHGTHLQELRRGTVVLACLIILREPNYGYALLDQLERSGFGVYPLLRRLEKQGLLTSDWNTEEARPRKFYRTSAEGAALAEVLSRDWDALNTAFLTLRGQS
jgi:PadR family transcriptional regulator PadR